MSYKNLAGGLGGREPENIWTRTPTYLPKKRKCKECGSSHLLKDLSDPGQICVSCRRFGRKKKSRKEMLKQQREKNFQETGFKETDDERRERKQREQNFQETGFMETNSERWEREQREKNFQETGFMETNSERKDRETEENFTEFGFRVENKKITELTLSGFFGLLDSPQTASNETIICNLRDYGELMSNNEKSMELIFNAFTVIARRKEIPKKTRNRIIRQALINCRRKKLEQWTLHFEELQENLN